ncbi:hypothetical protein [uncultured Maricaulis sp.]|nr:hypothetical protein [uncultured Maricaulis sp.]
MRSAGALPGVIYQKGDRPAVEKLADLAEAGPIGSGTFPVRVLARAGGLS